VRLNLGCGTDRRPGFVNVDIRPGVKPDRVGDVRRLDWVPDESVEQILARDVLEHVSWRETDAVLAEWFRVLKPGGVLHLQLPDLKYLANHFWFAHWNDLARKRELVRWFYGDQDYAENTHRSGFDKYLLRDALHRAGFERIEITDDGGANLLALAVKADR